VTLGNSSVLAEFSIGRAVSDAISLTRNVIYPALNIALPFSVLTEVFSWLVQNSFDTGRSLASATLWLDVVLGIVVATVITGAGYALLMCLIVVDREGARATVSEAIHRARPFIAPAIGLGILSALGVYSAMILLVIPGLYLNGVWFVNTPALVNEKIGILDAFARSADLTRGHRWPILGLVTALFVATYGLSYAGHSIVPTIANALSIGQWTTALYYGVDTLTDAVFMIVNAGLAMSVYFSLRDDKEGPSGAQVSDIFA